MGEDENRIHDGLFLAASSSLKSRESRRYSAGLPHRTPKHSRALRSGRTCDGPPSKTGVVIRTFESWSNWPSEGVALVRGRKHPLPIFAGLAPRDEIPLPSRTKIGESLAGVQVRRNGELRRRRRLQ